MGGAGLVGRGGGLCDKVGLVDGKCVVLSKGWSGKGVPVASKAHGLALGPLEEKRWRPRNFEEDIRGEWQDDSKMHCAIDPTKAQLGVCLASILKKPWAAWEKPQLI